MFSVVSLILLLIGAIVGDSVLYISAGLFAIAGAIEYAAYKVFTNK